jgi:hypothetical protein
MTDPTGESKSEALRLDFDRRLMLRFRGSMIASDGGLLAFGNYSAERSCTATQSTVTGGSHHFHGLAANARVSATSPAVSPIGGKLGTVLRSR